MSNLGKNISNIWTTIKTFVSTTVTNIWNKITSVFNSIKSTIVTIFTAVKDKITSIWNSITSTITSVINKIKDTVSSVFNNVKETVSSIWNGITSTISNAINNAKSIVSNVVGGIRDTMSGAWNSITGTVSSVWSTVKSTISDAMEGAKQKVKNVIDAIKGFFNFTFSWPKISLPHFSISPSGWKIGDLLKGTIPTLGISWYAKAMDEPYVFSQPTLFGAGEAGDEIMYGHAQLMRDIENAVNNGNDQSTQLLAQLVRYVTGGNLQGDFADAIEGLSMSFDKREIGRMVKSVS
jgi:hypothetical protein